MTDTIFALATAPGRAAVAVIRVSGPGAAKALGGLAGRLPPAREARVRRLRGHSGETLDQALVLWTPGPHSYTGEDSGELHLHGGAAIVDAVSDALLAHGLRPAEPGEFTRRAFENGRLDLTQAEAIADLVDAETEAQRRQALAQLGGALSRRYAAWRETLLEALAGLEAAIDFPDEDLPQDVDDRARPHVEELERSLEAALGEAVRGERVREGFRIALIGAPNAGKSSLFNRLVGREAAIVTATPGTTRDVIEAPALVEGYRVVIADMAGLRAADEAIEAEGVRRARAWAEAADLRLWAVDAADGRGAWREGADLVRYGDMLVLNKTDLAVGADRREASVWAAQRGLTLIESSAMTAAGVTALQQALSARVLSVLAGGEFPAATRARHRARLEEALGAVRQAGQDLGRGPELAAEDLRLADRALGRIAGRIDTEEVLGRIFASFCIGK